MNENKVKELIKELLIEIGEDPEREGLKTTPDRVMNRAKTAAHKVVSSAGMCSLNRCTNTTLTRIETIVPPIRPSQVFFGL